MEPDVPRCRPLLGGRTIGFSGKAVPGCGYGHLRISRPVLIPVRVSRICLVLSHGLALSRNFAAEVRYVHAC